MGYRKMSVAFLVIIVLVTAATLLLGAFGFVNYESDRNRRWALLRSGLGVEADEVAVSLALPVWNIDRGQIDKIIESVMNDPNIYGIVVKAAGRIHARGRGAKWEIVPVDSGISEAGLLIEERSITYSRESIGSVVVYATPKFIEENLRSSLLSIFSMIFLLDLLLVLTVYLLLWRTVLKPLKQVEGYAFAVSSGKKSPENGQQKRFRGELENLRSSIEKMVTLLESRYDLLQAEMKQRRESEERFARLSEAAFEGIVISKEGQILDANDQFAKIFGLERLDIIGTQVGILVAPESKELVGQKMQSGSEGPYEHMALRPNGSVFPVEVHAKSIPYKGEKIRVTAVRDVTERRRAEEALRKSEAHYRALVENTPDIIAGFDREGRYLFVNSSVSSVSSLKPEEFIGKRMKDVGFTNDEAESRENAIREVFKTRMPFETEFSFTGKDGLQYYEWRVYPVIDAEGNVLSVFCISRNISDRKLSEGALRASMEQLHMLAARLQNVREEERKTISHEVHDELGQVLTAIKMDLMNVKELELSERNQFETRILSTIGLMDSAIEIVQDVSARLRPGMLDYLGLLAAVDWQAEEFQKHSGVVCRLNLPDHELAVDDERSTVLFRIFQETLTNVARHAQATNLEVSLSDSPDELIMTVVDNGIGISEELADDPKSLGLLGMRERLHPFKGTCTIRKGANGGTEVIVRLPK